MTSSELPWFIWDEILVYISYFSTKGELARVNRRWLEYFGKELALVEVTTRKDITTTRRLSWFGKIVERINFHRWIDVDWELLGHDYPNLKRIQINCYRKGSYVPIGFMLLSYNKIESLTITLSHTGLLDITCLQVINLFQFSLKELIITIGIFQPWDYSKFFNGTIFTKLTNFNLVYSVNRIPYNDIINSIPNLLKLTLNIRATTSEERVQVQFTPLPNLIELRLIPPTNIRELGPIKLNLIQFPNLVTLELPGETELIITNPPITIKELHLHSPKLELLRKIKDNFLWLETLTVDCSHLQPEELHLTLELCNTIRTLSLLNLYDPELLSDLPYPTTTPPYYHYSVTAFHLINSRNLQLFTLLPWLTHNFPLLTSLHLHHCYSLSSHTLPLLTTTNTTNFLPSQLHHIHIQTYCPKALRAFRNLFDRTHYRHYLNLHH